ncbi:hypothetical protein Tco_1500083 [Tanacetum coccineum]
MEDDKEKEDLKQCFEIVQDDEVGIDAIPLATKPAPIVNFQIHKFDREDLENLWKLVKSKHGNTRPEEGYERVLWGSYEHYKSVEAEEEHPEPGFELQGAKMVEIDDPKIIWSREYLLTWDAKRPGEDMCGTYRVMWRGYGMSKEGYRARWRWF